MAWLSRIIPSKQVWSFPKTHRGLFFPSGLAEAKEEMDQLNSNLAQQELKEEYLSDQSKRNNFSIKRIVEGEETWDEFKSKVK